MKRAIDTANHISENLDKDCIQVLRDINLYHVFENILFISPDNSVINTIICGIIFSYDNESTKIDLRQDGYDINKNILLGLKADMNNPIFTEFIELKNTDILDAIGGYLDTLADWRFVSARKMIDYHAKYIRETEPQFTDMDDDKKIKARENIGRLIKESISQRHAADELIRLIEKDFVTTNHKVESDFGVKFTDTTIKRDPLSWRQFIRDEVIPKRKLQKST